MNPLLLFGVMLFVFTQIIQINKHNPTRITPSICSGDHPVHLLPGNNGRRRAEPRGAREHPAPGALPAPGDPAVGRPSSFFNLVAEPRGRVPVHHRRRHRAVLELARAAAPDLPLADLFATGTGMLLSALYVRFRDIQPIWSVCLQMLYYGSPIIYTIETADAQASVRPVLRAHPRAQPARSDPHRGARRSSCNPSAPSAAEAAGGALLRSSAIIVGCSSSACGTSITRLPDLGEALIWARPRRSARNRPTTAGTGRQRRRGSHRCRTTAARRFARLTWPPRTSACGLAWRRSRPSWSRSRPGPTRPSPQAQERTYWLDRWHLDLNALMRRPGAAELRASRPGHALVRAQVQEPEATLASPMSADASASPRSASAR